jgi:hypothetical protein
MTVTSKIWDVMPGCFRAAHYYAPRRVSGITGPAQSSI